MYFIGQFTPHPRPGIQRGPRPPGAFRKKNTKKAVPRFRWEMMRSSYYFQYLYIVLYVYIYRYSYIIYTYTYIYIYIYMLCIYIYTYEIQLDVYYHIYKNVYDK